LGGANRFDFYDHTKIYAAAPPDVLRANEKYLREHYVFNVLGLILTTNHKTDGIYLPAEDRRHYVAWSPHTKEEFSQQYWRSSGLVLHRRLRARRTYLTELDLSTFDPKAPPRRPRRSGTLSTPIAHLKMPSSRTCSMRWATLTP
jgi:hypothetical protein